jgi:hypothetical protein
MEKRKWASDIIEQARGRGGLTGGSAAMGTIRVARYIGSVAIMAILFSACATAAPPEPAPSTPPAPAAAAQSAPRSGEHIYVTGDTLDTACYKEVGEVSYVEPFSAAVTDPDNLGVADQLRKLAVDKYPDRVDAIINVHSEDHDIGSEVLVSGEAVQIEPPSKIDCKLPEKLAAAFANFATGAKTRGSRRGSTNGSGYNGPAGTTNTAAEAEGSAGSDPTKNIRENLRRAMLSTMPGQTDVNESALTDQVQLQQAEIKRLRREIDQVVGRQCEKADLSAAQCDSMRKNAEFVQPHEVVAVPNTDASEKSPTVFEIQNLIQAQTELISKLRQEAANLNEAPDEASGAGPSN